MKIDINVNTVFQKRIVADGDTVINVTCISLNKGFYFYVDGVKQTLHADDYDYFMQLRVTDEMRLKIYADGSFTAV